VRVVATGVRELKSKMRGSLDTLQVVTFEYVEGREVNRLTGIHEGVKFENIFSIAKRRVLSNIVNFVLRTVLGETSNEKLYESVLFGIKELDKSDEKNLLQLEIIWLIKILVALGYWEEGKYDQFENSVYVELKDESRRAQITEEINKAIRSTHL
jgi:recombinational DNA repair protein (RecF pathway)